MSACLILFNFVGCAVNATMYAVWGHWYNLLVAIFAGLVGLWIAVVDA